MSDQGEPSTGAAGQENELRRLRHELAQATNQLEQLQRRKSSLLAMATHDLRTPLAIIQGYLQLLAADLAPDADPTIQDYITNIMAHSDSLGKMVENLIALDQFERGEIRLSVERSNLNELVEHAIAQVEGLTKIKNLTIGYRSAPAPAWVEVDEDQIRRALYNLLSHAIKYARPDTELGITIEQDGPFYRVQFHDPHRLLPADILSKLFDLAEIGQEGMNTLRGMDLGLVLTRHVAEHHGGRVAAASTKDLGMSIDLYLPASDG